MARSRFFAVLFAALLLAACDLVGAPASTPQPTAVSLAVAPATAIPSPAPPLPTEAPAITALPQPTPEPAALQIWAAGTKGQADALQRVLEDIGRQAGVEVSVAVKSADTIQADVRSNALAGLPQPDLFWGTQEDLGLLHRNDLLAPAVDELSNDGFIPATVAAATIDGQRWGTPVAADGFLLLLYNKKLASAAPQTTDALITASRDVKGSGKTGMVAAWAEPRWFAAWLAGEGGALVGPDGAPTLNTPQVIAAFNLLKELRVGGPASPSTYDDGVDLFTGGDAAYAIDGDWALQDYREYTDTLDLGVARMPLVPGGNRIAAPPINGVYLMYNKNLSPARAAKAQALARVATTPAAQAQIARELGVLPALQSALADPAVSDNPVLAAAAIQLDGAIGLPSTPGIRCAFKVLEVALPNVLLDDQTPEEAAERMQSDANACVSQNQ